MARTLFRNLRVLTPPFAANEIDRFVNQIRPPRQAIIVANGKIDWIGPEKKISKAFSEKKGLTSVIKEVDLDGRTVLPGFVESHTHSLFAGSRAHEFEWRLAGVPYPEIYQRGGGILSSVRAVRKTSESELLMLGQKRVDSFVRQGVTTLEIKSGYGLRDSDEFKLLRVAKSLQGPEIVPTYLGLHALSPDFATAEEYVEHVIRVTLPKLKKQKLTGRCDIYIEKGFFSVELGERYLRACRELGFATTIHADQIHRTGATVLGAKLAAQSCDHAIQVTDDDIAELAKTSTVAVLLPMADLYMKCAYPPARKMLDRGVRVALATDFNPGTSPSQDLALVGLLARLQMQMSLEEVIEAYTLGGAHALGLGERKGQLREGFDADFAVLSGSPTELFYSAGQMPIESVYRGGRRLRVR